MVNLTFRFHLNQLLSYNFAIDTKSSDLEHDGATVYHWFLSHWLYISCKQLNNKFAALRRSHSVLGYMNCRRLQWAGQVVWSGETRNTHIIVVENVCLEEQEAGGRILLRWI
jgi:hypothetical protein